MHISCVYVREVPIEMEAKYAVIDSGMTIGLFTDETDAKFFLEHLCKTYPFISKSFSLEELS